ncbi:hypothetical protein L208DRAFT_1418768 [Tricholoma matsutake]|nr:hypothetical protein L208DRAFT_1418768 [Tricholoma matsutake 945]
MAPGDGSVSLDSIINQITTATNAVTLNHNLRNTIPKESRDTILSSALAGGQDPLGVLDMRQNTLGVLYIMSARLLLQGAVPPPWQLVQEFCETFIPEHARLAPDRVTLLAKGIVYLADRMKNLSLAIQPLYDLVRRYPPDLSYLTTIHPIFVLTCVTSRHFTPTLPVLSVPITNIDTSLSDLHYNDNLTYHYSGGCALAALKRWSEAEEFFEICASSPGIVPSAIQLEALKKLRLVQLIASGKPSSLPKYIHPLLNRILKNTPYNTLINAYPHNTELLEDVLEKERQLFNTDKNTGLVMQAIDRAPRWALKRLTATYVTLGLADIARAVKIESEDEVRDIVLSMIESGDISARISADGTVTFSDPPPEFTKAQVDAMLADVQEQTGMLSELDSEVGRSREFLNKAVKNREEGTTSWGAADEDMYNVMGSSGGWIEENVFS